MSALNRPNIEFDDEAEVMTVNGIKFSYAVVDIALQPSPIGCWYRVKEIAGDTLIIEERNINFDEQINYDVTH